MLLDHRRLLTSETWIEAALLPRLGHALMSLWCESFQQVPAASLPSNDLTLLRLSMCPTPAEWRKVKDRALAGWVKCSDGRLYHPVVAEKALEAWLEKLASRLSSGAGNAKRWKIDFDPAPVEEQMRVARGMLAALNPQSRSLAKRRTAGVLLPSKGDPNGNPKGIPSGSQEKGSGREGTNSEAKASAAKAAAKQKSPEEMAKSELWKAAVSVLEHGGCPADQCRTFMGKLVSDYSYPIVKDAVAAAVSAQPAEAREYLIGACQRLSGERKSANKQEALEASNKAVGLRWVAEHGETA